MFTMESSVVNNNSNKNIQKKQKINKRTKNKKSQQCHTKNMLKSLPILIACDNIP